MPCIIITYLKAPQTTLKLKLFLNTSIASHINSDHLSFCIFFWLVYHFVSLIWSTYVPKVDAVWHLQENVELMQTKRNFSPWGYANAYLNLKHLPVM